MRRRWLLVASVWAGIGLMNSGARSDVVSWTNAAGGAFGVPANWSPGLVPGPADNPRFWLASQYLITLDESRQIHSASVRNGAVTFALGGHTLSSSIPFGSFPEFAFEVGGATGSTSATFLDGAVTLDRFMMGSWSYPSNAHATAVFGAGSVFTTKVVAFYGAANSSNTLRFQDGAQAVFEVRPALNSGQALMTVTGAGTHVEALMQETTLGNYGQGEPPCNATLEATDGGYFTAYRIYLQGTTGTTQTLRVDGGVIVCGGVTDESFADQSPAYVIEVLGGGQLTTSSPGDLATAPGATVEGLVSGSGSDWLYNGAGWIGARGTAHVQVRDGGRLLSSGSLARDAGSVGTLDVCGVGSQYLPLGAFVVGNLGTGTLTVEMGGRVGEQSGGSYADLQLGVGSGSTGTFTARDPGSSWEDHLGNTSVCTVGVGGHGVLNVLAGARVVRDQLNVASGVGSMGEVVVSGAMSELTCGPYDFDGKVTVGKGGVGSLTVDDGATASFDWLRVGENAGSSGVVAVNGTDSKVEVDLALGAVIGIGGNGRLELRDGGRLEMATGPVLVGAGVGTLWGDGVIVGAVECSGSLEPGDPVGVLAIEGSLALNSSATTHISLGGVKAGVTHDQIVVTGNANVGGALEVTTVDGFQPQVGQVFDVIRSVVGTGVVTGEFSSVTPSNMYQVTYTATRVRLEVIPPVVDADFNDDGIVDGADLGQLLGSWGPCPGGKTPCPADFNNDGVVDGADLGVLLANWG